MCCLEANDRRVSRLGLTLVELILVMVVSGILFVVSPPLLSHGVKTLVFLPNALAANNVALEVTHQLTEGGFSTLQATPVLGLRCAIRTVPTGDTVVRPALWLAETNRLGFLAANGQYVLIRLASEVVKRSLPATSTTCSTVPAVLTEEDLPYTAAGTVRILTTGALFRYYNQSGVEIAPSCPPSTTIRRVDMTFTAQTGSGLFDEGQTTENIQTSVAIRIP